MNKSILSIVWLAVIVAVVAGCVGSGSIESDYKEGVNFADYKTYRWHDKSAEAKGDHDDDILDGRIRAAVDEELQAKGFLRVGSEKTDFSVNYSVTVQEKTDIRSYDTYSGMSPGFSMGYGRSGYRYGHSIGYSSASEVRTFHYEEGTFVIDVVDGNDKLVWRGSAEGRLKKNLTVEEKRQGIKDVTAKVLMNFPPKPES